MLECSRDLFGGRNVIVSWNHDAAKAWSQGRSRPDDDLWMPRTREGGISIFKAADSNPALTICSLQGADSESEYSEHHKRVKHRHSSISGDEPAQIDAFRASDSEANLLGRHRHEGPSTVMHYGGPGLPGGASSTFRGNFTGSTAAAQPGGAGTSWSITCSLGVLSVCLPSGDLERLQYASQMSWLDLGWILAR